MSPVVVSRRRVSRVIGYTMFGLAGVSAMIWPAPSVAAATGGLVYVWAAWLAVGGFTCSLGSFTDRWLGEYVGLPLLYSAFFVYSVVIGTTGRLTSIAGALALGAFGAVLFARWQDISQVRKEATVSARLKSGG